MKKSLEKISFWIIRVITFDYLVVKRIIRKYIKSRGQVLDLGCGNGYLSSLFDPEKYLGVEINNFLVREAKSKYPNYTFRSGDITSLNLKKKFEFVIVIGVLHHLNEKDFEKALDVIRKHIRPDGKAIMLEAIPPISKFNIIGALIRAFDKGSFVRSFEVYKKKVAKYFEIKVARKVRGGIVDYALFVGE